MIDKHETWCINASSMQACTYAIALKETSLKLEAWSPSWSAVKTLRVFSLLKHTIYKSGIYTESENKLKLKFELNAESERFTLSGVRTRKRLLSFYHCLAHASATDTVVDLDCCTPEPAAASF
jgi:hypothetical protein